MCFFQETPNSYGIGGAVLICFAIVLSAIKKVLDEKLSSDHPIKAKYFKILFNQETSAVDLECKKNTNETNV